MAAIWRGNKQYFVEYESDKMICGSYNHTAGNASTINSAKSIIRKIRKILKRFLEKLWLRDFNKLMKSYIQIK